MKYIKIPGPGQFRGEGEWQECNIEDMFVLYDYCLKTGYLPVKEEECESQES